MRNKKIKSILLAVLMIFSMFISPLKFVPLAANAATNPVANFSDPNLNLAIHNWVGIPVSQDVYQSDLAAKLQTTSTLQLVNKNISSLSGMEIFSGLPLKTLYLSSNSISDITPLNTLTSIQTLSLDQNKISDISPLAGLTNLTDLYINYNTITSLSPLQNLTSLQTLQFSGTSPGDNFSDISPLSGLTNLTSITLSVHNISDISPLSNLTKLTYLELGSNKISDLTPLSNLTQLNTLYLDNNKITNVSPLSSLTNLTLLNLGNATLANNNVADITPLKNLTNLQSLDLSWNKDLVDISPLSTLTNLQQLYLGNDFLTDISGLQTLTNLNQLFLPVNFVDVFSGSNKTFVNSIQVNDLTPQNKLAIADQSNNLLTNLNLTEGQTMPLTVQVLNTFDGTNFSPVISSTLTNVIKNQTIFFSSDPSIVSVNGSNQLVASNVGTATITAKIYPSAVNWGVYTFNVTVSPKPAVTLTGLTVSPKTATILVGETQQYTATASYSDGSKKDVTNGSAWSVSDSNIASIDGSGLANGATVGQTNVTATYNGMSDTANLTVNAPAPPVITPTPTSGGSSHHSSPYITALTVTPKTATVLVDETQQYIATASYSDGSKKDVTNSSAWSVSDSNIASIDGSGLANGAIVGQTNVTATYNGMLDTANLTVNAPAPPVITPTPTSGGSSHHSSPYITALTVTPKTATVLVDETQQYIATASYSDGSKKDVTNSSSWSVSDFSKAAISNSGLATGKEPGKINVTANYNGMSDTAILKIITSIQPIPVHTNQKLIALTLSPNTATVFVGQTQQYIAIASYSDGTTKDVTSISSWSLSDTSKASMNNSGLATGTAAGETNVTASYNGMSDTAKLIVTVVTSNKKLSPKVPQTGDGSTVASGDYSIALLLILALWIVLSVLRRKGK